MSHRSTLACLVFGLALDACGTAGPDTPLARQSQAIAGGTTDTGDPAVVALVDSSGAEHCTGTLIAPRAVLTAGHCAGVTGGAVFGATASAARRVGIASVDRHPRFTGMGHGYDVAVMHLASAVTDIAPVPIADRGLPSDVIGMTVRHVGFGVTNDTTNVGRGTKRTVSYPFTRFDADPGLIWSGNVTTHAQTCNGDSGGPALFMVAGHEQIVALVSDGPPCPAPEGNDARIDLPDIRAWIRTTAHLCTPGSLYCGGDVVAGDSNTLYRCTDGNNATTVTPCASGCVVRAGQDDVCAGAADAGDVADAGSGDASADDGGSARDAAGPSDTGVSARDADGADAHDDGATEHALDSGSPGMASGGCRAAPGMPRRAAGWLGALVVMGLARARRRARRRGAGPQRTNRANVAYEASNASRSNHRPRLA